MKNILVGIIGAGPAGLNMACTLSNAGIPYILIDKGQIGQTIFDWPQNTRFHSSHQKIGIGNIPIASTYQERLSKDEYLSYLRQVVDIYKMNIRLFENVIDISNEGAQFLLTTKDIHYVEQSYKFSHIILATGCMDKKFLPDISGIRLPHVKDTNLQLHNCFKRKILIIGGRHSALEYAIKAQHIGASEVTICSRTDPFEARVLKNEVIDTIKKLVDGKKVSLQSDSIISEINRDCVILKKQSSSELIEIKADWIIVACGYESSSILFNKLKISELTNGELYVDSLTMETNIKNVFIIGTAQAGTQSSEYSHFIENTLFHAEKVLTHIKETLTGYES